jgi:hypothetical protein
VPGAQRRLQIALGLIWLVDGALQCQPLMFGRSFISQIILPNEAGQPSFIAAPISWSAHLIEPRVVLFNTFAAAIQLLIGLGLIYRPMVKSALLTSFGWAFGVWWIGEGLGGLLTGSASPLTGAPGAALLYVIAGAIAWPRDRSQPGGDADAVPGRRRARLVWAALWFGSAALWLLPPNRAAGAVHDQIANAPPGAGWLSSLHSALTSATGGRGLAIAIVAASLSAAIGTSAIVDRWARASLALSVAIGLVYFVIGQGMGGVLTGSGTDPGSGPLLILLAISLYQPRRARRRDQQPIEAGPRSPREPTAGRTLPTANVV